MKNVSGDHISVVNKDNIVRFITNWSPLLLYELKMLRVSCPSSEVQQRSITKNIAIFGLEAFYLQKISIGGNLFWPRGR